MNRLASETSPYLLQHAANPVDWHPWGPEALALAREADKPILLSIGYSSCHWCHVMAHECFEDPEVAALMNERFINIKVDREERPDLDQIYQTAHQMLAQRPGGWPLTMFLTPDGTPFFGGTYFPKQARHGLPGLPDLLERVAGAFRERRADIEAQNREVVAALERTLPQAGEGESDFNTDILAQAMAELDSSFDRRRGGFGGAPKFPRPGDLDFLLRRHAASGDRDAREMALSTLTRMAEGGIHDQLGGGFYRYSVDATWTIPHFEKMLYDNGQLLGLYADAWNLDRHPLFAQAAEGIVAWAQREMRDPAGGFYAAMDADSEGVEGRYYLWTPAAVQALLTPEEWTVASVHWGLDGTANFTDEGHDLPPEAERERWHLRIALTSEQAAEQAGQSPAEARRHLASARTKLLAARQRRIPPGRDDKVLTAWNALMVKGLARAARAFGRPQWLAMARETVDFLRSQLWCDGRLLATYQGGQARLPAYLDDHALLLDALLELLQAGWRDSDLQFARQLGDVLLSHFEDPNAGGFFFTAHDHEKLVYRTKPLFDNATPGGNGITAFSLQRLALITGEQRYERAAWRTLALFYPEALRQASAAPSFLAALEEHLAPPALVVLTGPAADVAAWQEELARQYLPRSLVLAPIGENCPPPLAKPATTTVNAWVCSGVNCLPPIDGLSALMWTVSKPVKVL